MVGRTLEELLGEDPDTRPWIDPPESALRKNTKNLTSAELTSLGFNVAGTALASALTTSPLGLALGGPLIEKGGFLAHEALHALYSEKPFSQAFSPKNVAANIAADIAGHDPAYVAMMAGLVASGAHPLIASGVSFFAAIPVAASVQTLGGELAHRALKGVTRVQGFHWEDYYETRFLARDSAEAERVFFQVSNRFNLGDDSISTYTDTYHEHRVPAFGNRLGHVRSRQIEGERSSRNVELAYTLARKRMETASPYILHYVHKEKGIRPVQETLPPSLARLVRPESRTISFTRRVRHDDDIRVTLDTVPLPSGESVSFLELKAFTEEKNFKKAADYLLQHGDTIMTNYPKIRLYERLTNKNVQASL
jgi:hypothetical protein